MFFEQSPLFFTFFLGMILSMFLCACETIPLSDAPISETVASRNVSAPTLRDLKPQGFYHTVERGDTLWSIAKTYDISLDHVVAVNRLPDAEDLDVGQMIFIPGRRSAEDRLSLKNKMSAVPFESDFIWPVKGRIINQFNDEVDGYINRGIDIVADAGAEIHAARSGVVTFSDAVLGGKGTMIIINHRANFQTVYAYNRMNLVKEGDVVRQGQVIGYVGSSGRLNRTALHFEIRNNSVPRDPSVFLPS